MTNVFDKMLWAYRAVFTQTNVAGGKIQINITFRERVLVLYGTVGPDNYAAARAISGYLLDSDGNIVSRILFGTDIDDLTLPFPNTATAAIVGNSGNQFGNRMIVGNDDVLVIKAETPVQTETMTIAIRALVNSSKPAVTTTGSGGTVTTTVSMDKVI